MSDVLHTWSNDTLRIRVMHDPDPLNPRTEFDNITHLACTEHRNYQLGDEDAVRELHNAIERIVEAENLNIDDEYIPCPKCQTWSEDPLPNDDTEVEILTHENPFTVAIQGPARLIRPETVKRWRQYRDDCDCDGDSEIENPNFVSTESLADCAIALSTIDPDEEYVFLRELFLYDHGGITMSTGTFSDPWDSGKVGIGFMTSAEALEHFGATTDMSTEQLREAAHKAIDADVSEYATYLEGRVYSFRCERLLPCPEDWDIEEWAEHDCHWDKEDSCCGFFGRYDAPKKNGMYDHWPEEYRAMYEEEK